MSPSTIVSLCLSKAEKQPAVLNTSLVLPFFLLKSTSSHLEVHAKTREGCLTVTEEKVCGEQEGRGSITQCQPHTEVELQAPFYCSAFPRVAEAGLGGKLY